MHATPCEDTTLSFTSTNCTSFLTTSRLYENWWWFSGIVFPFVGCILITILTRYIHKIVGRRKRRVVHGSHFADQDTHIAADSVSSGHDNDVRQQQRHRYWPRRISTGYQVTPMPLVASAFVKMARHRSARDMHGTVPVRSNTQRDRQPTKMFSAMIRKTRRTTSQQNTKTYTNIYGTIYFIFVLHCVVLMTSGSLCWLFLGLLLHHWSFLDTSTSGIYTLVPELTAAFQAILFLVTYCTIGCNWLLVMAVTRNSAHARKALSFFFQKPTQEERMLATKASKRKRRGGLLICALIAAMWAITCALRCESICETTMTTLEGHLILQASSRLLLVAIRTRSLLTVGRAMSHLPASVIRQTGIKNVVSLGLIDICIMLPLAAIELSAASLPATDAFAVLFFVALPAMQLVAAWANMRQLMWRSGILHKRAKVGNDLQQIPRGNSVAPSFNSMK